eukprot:sb/3471216/
MIHLPTTLPTMAHLPNTVPQPSVTLTVHTTGPPQQYNYIIPPSTTPPEITGPTSPELQMVQTAIRDIGDFARVKEFICNTTFPVNEHPELQKLWFEAVYGLTRTEKGLPRLTPAVRYRLRKQNPVPPSIASTTPVTNNFHSTDNRALMEEVWRVTRHPDQAILQTLSEQTGLSVRQVKTFFKNKRSRA